MTLVSGARGIEPAPSPAGTRDRPSQTPRSTGAGPYYPIAPFREWLFERLRHAEQFQHMTQAEFAASIGIAERRLHGWLYENTVVTLSGVDAVLCEYGDPSLLDELCPVGAEVSRSPRKFQRCPHGDDAPRGKDGRCLTCRRVARERRLSEQVAA